MILLHFICYAVPPILGSFFDDEVQIYLNYTYLGILFSLTQLFDSLYAINITDQFFLNGGDIAYSALIFATVYLIITRPDPKIVRNLIHIIFILGIFLFLLFILLHYLLSTSEITNYLGISSVFLEFSYKSLLFSFLLYSSEIILMLLLIRKWVLKLKNRFIITICVGLIYFAVLVLDGIAYPLGINVLFPGSHFSVQYGIFAKLIFGVGFGTILFFLLNLRPGHLSIFIDLDVPLIQYLIAPRKSELQKKLVKAEKEIKVLRDILPICANCKKIRDDEGYWNQLEQYLSDHQSVQFSHGLCPDCMNAMLSKLEKTENV